MAVESRNFLVRQDISLGKKSIKQAASYVWERAVCFSDAYVTTRLQSPVPLRTSDFLKAGVEPVVRNAEKILKRDGIIFDSKKGK